MTEDAEVSKRTMTIIKVSVGFALEFMELYLNPTSCWPDYVIEP